MSETEENDIPEGARISDLPAISSGSLQLDIALGAGGISCGQFVEISGAESSGKTTLCQHIIAGAQQMGRLCAWIDTDHSFNPAYAQRCGVELGRLYFASPPDAEQAFDILEALSGTGAGNVIVMDSVDALTPRSEFDLPLGVTTPLFDDEDHGEKLLSLALRKLAPWIQRKQAIILFTTKAQRQRSEAYHQLSTHLSRLALKLHAGLRLRIQETSLVLQDEITIGQRVQVKILKSTNVVSPQPVEFDIIYDQGINHSGEVFDLGLQLGLIRQQRKGYTFQSLSLGTGRGQAIQTLERRAMIRPMEQAIRQKLLRTSISAET